MFFLGGDQPRATLGHIGHVPIRVDVTFILVPMLYLGNLPQQDPIGGLMHGVLLTAGLFVSILLHELGHGIVAHRNRMHVEELVVGGFYGYARLHGLAPTRLSAALVLFAGPLANLSIFLWLWVLIGFPTVSLHGGIGAPLLGYTTIYHYPTLYGAAWSLAMMNFAMFVFNLMPAFPLDGGRIWRLLLSKRMENADAVKLIAGFGIAVGIVVCLLSGSFSFIGLLVGLQIAWQNYEAFHNPTRALGD